MSEYSRGFGCGADPVAPGVTKGAHAGNGSAWLKAAFRVRAFGATSATSPLGPLQIERRAVRIQ